MSDFPIRSRKGGANPYVSSDAHMPETKPPREPGAAYVFVPTLAACALLLLYVGVGVVTGVSTDYGVSSVRGSSANVLRVATWNIAAINNNPFEYWITHDDEAYNKLMSDVQAFVSEPGDRDRDVRVEEVFSDQMWEELSKKMKEVGWAGVDEVDKMWKDDFRSRKIVGDFLTDSTLGKKRLASMPDRVTNTIRTENGNVMRPTVINCFSGDLGTQEKWFEAVWKSSFGRPTPSTRRCHRDRVGSIRNSLVDFHTGSRRGWSSCSRRASRTRWSTRRCCPSSGASTPRYPKTRSGCLSHYKHYVAPSLMLFWSI